MSSVTGTWGAGTLIENVQRENGRSSRGRAESVDGFLNAGEKLIDSIGDDLFATELRNLCAGFPG